MPKPLNVAVFGLIGFLCGPMARGVLAQEGKGGGKEPPQTSFFKRTEIDFWGTEAKKNETALTSPRRMTTAGNDLYETVFAEPVRTPDGRYAIYVPPRQVLEFLEKPTRESARGYLDWQATRSRKIAAALELLETLKREELGNGTESDTERTRSKDGGRSSDQPDRKRDTTASEKKATGEVRLIYFRQAG